jgi:hypothetical protein
VPWSYFVTLTADPSRYGRVGPELWLKSWRWFHYEWLKECAVATGRAHVDEAGKLRGPWANGWRHGKGHPIWVVGLEPHRDGRLHCHALLRLTGELQRLDYQIGQALWAKRGRGRICRFEVPRSRDDVCVYVSEYVAKGGSDAITFSENYDAPRMS